MRRVNFVRTYRKSKLKEKLNFSRLDIIFLALVVLLGINLYRSFSGANIYTRKDIRELEEELDYNKEVLEGLNNRDKIDNEPIIRKKIGYKNKLENLLKELPRGVYATDIHISNDEESIIGTSLKRESVFLYLDRLNFNSNVYEILSLESKNNNFIFNIRSREGDNIE